MHACDVFFGAAISMYSVMFSFGGVFVIKSRVNFRALAYILAVFALSSPAYAYVGPGMGAGVIGVVLGLLGSVLLALFAVFWYPIKRMLFSNRAEEVEEQVEEQVSEKTEDGLSQVNPEDSREKL